MQSTWIFKPKFSRDIYNKVIKCFVDQYLAWAENGIEYHYETLKDGWVCLTAWMDSGSCDYYSETSFDCDPISGHNLTEDMLILLVEAGVAYQQDDPNPGVDADGDYYLEDVDITAVFAALSEKDTNVYAPNGAKCYVYPVGAPLRCSQHVDMLDAYLTLKVA